MSMSNTTKRVKEIRRKTRRKFSAEEKIRIVLDGLRGDPSMRFQEIGVDVTTEVDRIAKFLRKRSPHQDSQWCADFHEIAEFVATGVHHQQVGFIGNESASFCIGAYSNFYINDCH